MKSQLSLKRKISNQVFLTILKLSAFLLSAVLLLVFFYVIEKGLPSLDWNFFAENPRPVGEMGGGMANAIIGSFILIGISGLIGIPWGIGVGVFLSEYGQGPLGKTVRFSTDLLLSVPSIVVGLFAYSIIVIPMKGFSVYAGAFALAVILFPMVARATEEILQLIPNMVRESGLALGISRWKVILKIVVRGSVPALTTGVLLGIARIGGETAPLLFTSFGNQYWSVDLNRPIASLPVQIFNYSISPFEEWHRLAWGAAFVLVMITFTLNLLARLYIWKKVQ